MSKIVPILAAVMLVITCGCSQQSVNSANKDVQHDVSTVSTDAQKGMATVSKDVKPKAQELDLGARVTTALDANANLPQTIRVDASPTGVRLKGTVTSAKQKHLAGEIAKQTLPQGDTVTNDLTVAAAQ